MNPAAHGLDGVADAGVFLTRLLRVDRAALVRLRPAPPDPRRGAATALWAPLPWRVLVTRAVAGPGPATPEGAAADATVGAADLREVLAAGREELPARADTRWRWPLPTAAAVVLERVPAAALAATAEAAAAALREARDRGTAGERVLRDALLDHVTITVDAPHTPGKPDDFRSPPGEPVAVPQRLIQAVVRMGFLGALNGIAERSVDVCVSGTWVGLAAPYGTAWLPRSGGFTLNTQFVHTLGHGQLASSVRQWT
ncbi:hypothetical protein GCM10010124_33930 [Pilimelia terevasa]|uniref:Uncharacterized protein n=1 Tax=Pilimelia terevasa TaxID=53372 RepID=A0A8J3FJ98_9ACTN|nr:hypothetical protein [Pilimelia terevasa]GGK38300.1 hypothetical protein GCM10010124_33930 [Pilimelia terevasa]